MRRRISSAVGRISGRSAAAVIVCFMAFIAGSAAGTIFSGMVAPSGVFSNYFSSLFDLYTSGESVRADTLPVLVNTYIYHALVFICGFSVIGAVVIPLVAAMRGFSLAFSASALVRLYSGKGAVLALSVFGGTAVISVPCFLIISVLSLEASRQLCSAAFSQRVADPHPPYTGRYFFTCAVCFAILLIPALCEIFILPELLKAAILRI